MLFGGKINFRLNPLLVVWKSRRNAILLEHAQISWVGKFLILNTFRLGRLADLPIVEYFAKRNWRSIRKNCLIIPLRS